MKIIIITITTMITLIMMTIFVVITVIIIITIIQLQLTTILIISIIIIKRMIIVMMINLAQPSLIYLYNPNTLTFLHYIFFASTPYTASTNPNIIRIDIVIYVHV